MVTATATGNTPSPTREAIDPRALRNALGCYATGVAVVTALADGDTPVGLTVNSFTSVSLDPPLVLWSLSRRSPSRTAFEQASHFAVNVLTAEQQALSNRFATPRPDKFAGVEWQRGHGGAPLLADCLAWFQCRRHLCHDGGDHIILLGRVEAFDHEPERDPLVFLTGRYHQAQPTGATG